MRGGSRLAARPGFRFLELWRRPGAFIQCVEGEEKMGSGRRRRVVHKGNQFPSEEPDGGPGESVNLQLFI